MRWWRASFIDGARGTALHSFLCLPGTLENTWHVWDMHKMVKLTHFINVWLDGQKDNRFVEKCSLYIFGMKRDQDEIGPCKILHIEIEDR